MTAARWAVNGHASMFDAITPEALVSVHPLDAAALGLADGTSRQAGDAPRRRGCVGNRYGACTTRGNLFIPFSFREAAANTLTGDALDAVAKIPGFKVTAARLLPE